jgi:hypothetical protein
MLKKETISDFNEFRDGVIKEFSTENIFFRRKLTQGAFWVSLENDLADQLFRDERWFFGVKYHDELKTIDHGHDRNEVRTGIRGFNTNKK